MDRNWECKTLTKILFHKPSSLFPQYYKPFSGGGGEEGCYSTEAMVKSRYDSEGIHGMLSLMMYPIQNQLITNGKDIFTNFSLK